MATTTNYGWVTPDDTDLVKDGAAAIRTLGSSADTTTKNLNPETTLGDLSFRSSTSNVNTRIGIGTAGQNLTVVAGVPAWATASSGGMTLLSTTTLSGVTTTITGIDQTHNFLYILLEEFTWDTGTTNPRFSIDGSIAFIGWNINQPGSPPISNSASFTFFNLQDQNTATNAADLIGVITIDNYASTTSRKVFNYVGGAPTSNSNLISRFGIINTESAISQIRFTNSNGYAYNGGTVKIYGVK